MQLVHRIRCPGGTERHTITTNVPETKGGNRHTDAADFPAPALVTSFASHVF